MSLRDFKILWQQDQRLKRAKKDAAVANKHEHRIKKKFIRKNIVNFKLRLFTLISLEM